MSTALRRRKFERKSAITALSRPLGNVEYFPYTRIFKVFAIINVFTISNALSVLEPCETSPDEVPDFLPGFEPEQHCAGYLK
ncbi:MAG: hypothetical protein ACI8Z1_001730 [Candidatus Azotimanducaceae bacterium]|jgi:hypothetical protein